uniref:Uncharacterized protein n=1 Tax=Tetranychus urticae TaxID=32264 RepID=T1KTS8_TETUR
MLTQKFQLNSHKSWQIISITLMINFRINLPFVLTCSQVHHYS